jgi:hypothetical protein
MGLADAIAISVMYRESGETGTRKPRSATKKAKKRHFSGYRFGLLANCSVLPGKVKAVTTERRMFSGF